MDPNQGILKPKTSLISFFNYNAPKIVKALSHHFLEKMHSLQNRTVGINKELLQPESHNRSTTFIKIYDSNMSVDLNNKPSFSNTSNLRLNKEPKLNPKKRHPLEINIEEDFSSMKNRGIAELFQEILPRNRGWIMRKSDRHENKGSMVFLEILDNKLISTKPTSLKVKVLITFFLNMFRNPCMFPILRSINAISWKLLIILNTLNQSLLKDQI